MTLILWEATSYGLAEAMALQLRPQGYTLAAVTWSGMEQNYIADYVRLL